MGKAPCSCYFCSSAASVATGLPAGHRLLAVSARFSRFLHFLQSVPGTYFGNVDSVAENLWLPGTLVQEVQLRRRQWFSCQFGFFSGEAPSGFVSCGAAAKPCGDRVLVRHGDTSHPGRLSLREFGVLIYALDSEEYEESGRGHGLPRNMRVKGAANLCPRSHVWRGSTRLLHRH